MHSANKSGDLYKAAGVDTEHGDDLVAWLQRPEIKPNPLGEVVSGIGGFAALFRPNMKGMRDPLLVSGTDGVGTKVLLGLEQNKLEGLGIDLVAMCVNDIYTVGASPLFFLDYYASGKINSEDFKKVLTGIRDGCNQCGATLIGGETAELPGLYSGRHFDLAGFLVGMVDSSKAIGLQRVKAGDKLYALASSGFHSNGYSLIRKWLSSKPTSAILMQKLLAPTRIYAEIPELIKELGPEVLHAAAHITGGGISGNLPRVVPERLTCHIEKKALPTPPWMRDFVEDYGASLDQVEKIFNLGVGMILVVSANGKEAFEESAKKLKLNPILIGEITPGNNPGEVVYH